VIIILQHGQDLISAFFGAILHGAIPSIMPFLTEKLLPDQYKASLAALFVITKPAAVITYPQFEKDARKSSLGSDLRSILVSDQVNSESHISPEPDFTKLNGRLSPPHEIALLQHSSGTTGLQKGVALSHQSVFNQLGSYAKAINLAPTDVIVSWLPLYHDMGLIAGFILPVLMRIPLVLLSPFDWVRAPYRLLRAISRYRGTLSWLPNFAYNFCAQKIRDRDLENVDLSSLRAVINCSEPMYSSSHAMFLERFQPYSLRSEALATSYAMAENVFAVTQGGINEPVVIDKIDLHSFTNKQTAKPLPPENDDSNQSIDMVSAGRPIQDTQLRVIDKEGKKLPDRQIGEIIIQSNCMLTNYFNRPDITKDAFLNGWYKTGDLGYLADGELYVTGRKKDLIIVGGKNIYPQDLERLAGESDGVYPGRVVAFGVFNEKSGTEDIVIIAEADFDENQPDPVETQNRITADIRLRVTRGSDASLRFVKVVGRNWLVKTSSGKIARRANREKYLSEKSYPQH